MFRKDIFHIKIFFLYFRDVLFSCIKFYFSFN